MNSQKTMPYIKNSYYSTSSIPPDNLFVEAAHFIFEKKLGICKNDSIEL